MAAYLKGMMSPKPTSRFLAVDVASINNGKRWAGLSDIYSRLSRVPIEEGERTKMNIALDHFARM